ncbi:MAG: YggT family protein [Advenella sp.]|nr:YggT family protein [Advenella sp.]
MINSIFSFLLGTFFSLFVSALLVRAWMFWTRIHPFNPYAMIIYKATDWLVQPVRKIIPTSNKIDWTSLLLAWLCSMLHVFLVFSLTPSNVYIQTSLATLPLVGLFMTIKWTLTLVLWLCILQAILSWISPLSPIMPLLRALLDPMLNPIRRYLPSIGAVDFSPLVLILITQVLQIVLRHLMFG